MSPTGADQRRFSRSPRSQRSRSADVDRLRKYAERIEERRNTDGAEASRLYATKWLNLPKSPNFCEKSISDTLEITESTEKLMLRKNSQSSRDSTRNYSHWDSMQSDDDVLPSNDIHLCPDGRLLSFRWIPLPRLGDRPDYTQRTFSMELQSARHAANKWITFAKHPSPASSRSSLDRKSSMIKFSSYYDKEMRRKKCDTVVTTDDSGTTSPGSVQTKTKVFEDKKKLMSLEMKKCSVSSWMSRSSSDEDDGKGARRGSQDLEFNDRSERRKFSDIKCQLMKRFNEIKRNEDAGDEFKGKWRGKVEVEETDSTDDSRWRNEGRIVKGGSFECRSSSRMTRLPARRAHSYGDHRPVFDDSDSQSAKSMAMRQKRKSTRYKVYLT